MAHMAAIAPRWWGGGNDDGDNRHSTSVAPQKAGQQQRQSTGCEGNRLPTTTATGSGESGRGWMTKATNKSRQTMTASN
jgi:hypothetical protein